MIAIKNVVKVFSPSTAAEVSALNGIDLEIPKGEFAVVIGSNGSGKSTLLNSIAGSVQITSGTIHINGDNVSKLQEHERAKWISRIFQDPLAGTASELSIIDNCRIASLRTHPKKLIIGINNSFRIHIREQLSILNLGLENKLDQKAGNLSGGQRQALTLIMAVLDKPEVLLMDEPSSALDPATAEKLMHLADKIIRLHRLTAILVTHNLKDATRYGDRLLMMHEGKIVKDIDKNNQIIKAEDLLEWF